MRKLLPLIALLLFENAHAQEPLTYETGESLFSSSDLNLDGHTDSVVVDKDSGSFIVGFGRADGGFDWGQRQASGFAAPSGLGVGVFQGVLPVFAITAPEENRCTIYALTGPNDPVQSVHLFPTNPAPRALAAFHLDGDDTSDFLFAGDAGGSSYIETVNLDPPATLGTDSFPFELPRLWRMIPKTGSPARAAVVFGTQLRIFQVSTTGFGQSATMPGFFASADTRFTYGNYDGGDLAFAIGYNVGQPTATVSKLNQQGGNFGLDPSSTLTFPQSLALLVTVPSASGARLVASFTDGTAATYDFDGTTLTHRSALPGPHALVAVAGTDRIVTLQGTLWRTWDTSSGAATLVPERLGAYPAAGTAGSVANTSNIVIVDGEPLADPAAVPVFFGSVRDWTVSADGDDRDWTVVSLDQFGSGLGGQSSTVIDADPGGTHPLVNQYANDISIRLLEPAAFKAPVAEVRFDPPGGSFAPDASDPLQVNLATTLDPVAATIFYRIQPASTWQVYVTPIVVASTATIEARASGPGGQTPTRVASFTIENPDALATGDKVDADGDGMSDQWEDAFNAYDPLGDPDGDGVNNLAEFENCTDPRDASHSSPVPFQLSASSAGEYIELSWSISLANAVLQRSPDMQAWDDVTTGISSGDGRFIYFAPLTDDRRYFYRLRR